MSAIAAPSGIRALVSIDMPPLGMSYDRRATGSKGTIDALAGFFQGVQTAAGAARRRHLVRRQHHDRRRDDAGGDCLGGRAVARNAAASSPPTSSPTSASPTTWKRRSRWTRRFPSIYFVADHWAETAKPFLAKHCPNARVEAFGGHMMFWEYPDRFNALLAEFLSGL